MVYPKGGIAFFDSGIGGLTTLSTCIKYARENRFTPITYYYYGDNFRAPYGNLSQEQIFSYVDEIFFQFQILEVAAAVIACNTVTAVCAERLREKYPFPIIGIEPAIFPAMREGGEVFVLATCATCNSKKFQNLCERAHVAYPNATLKIFPCENLAGTIEKNLGRTSMDYWEFLPAGNPANVVLGCTHYIYIKKQIQAFYGCPVRDGNFAVAKRLFDVLVASKKELKTIKNNFTDTEEKRIQGYKNLNKKQKENFIKREEGNSTIFFLGDAKMVNKTKYEQMFAKK